MPTQRERQLDQRVQQLEVENFNLKHPVGTLVRYWRGAREGQPSGEGPTTYAAELMGGHTGVVWIEGCRGCIALSHVEVG
ncbi:hypothetical protein [Zavarzinia sp.]|jgi:hypothetical protein|uniref:hypothetical protein n=1 Tax=Zavarzinia sp. TaxID=2027920 RepID=UPI0035671AEF